MGTPGNLSRAILSACGFSSMSLPQALRLDFPTVRGSIRWQELT